MTSEASWHSWARPLLEGIGIQHSLAHTAMSIITLSTGIAAPIDRVFDLSRSIDLHQESTESTGERAVAGVTSGLIGLGESVTWRARHFGIWQHLTSRITRYERPSYFQDCMVEGAFESFTHDHRFAYEDGKTIMTDVFDFRSPCGFLGAMVDALVLKRYMARLLVERNGLIREVAESSRWRAYLPA